MLCFTLGLVIKKLLMDQTGVLEQCLLQAVLIEIFRYFYRILIFLVTGVHKICKFTHLSYTVDNK